MLSPAATKSIEHATSAITSVIVVIVVVTIVAALSARSLGGKSRTRRQAIFSIVSFLGICVAWYFGLFRMRVGA